MKALYTQQTNLPLEYVNLKIKEFLNEDRVPQDLTTQFTLLQKTIIIKADIIAEQNLIFAGGLIIKSIFRECDILMLAPDGSQFFPGDKIATIEGNAKTLLAKERVLLNLIQRLSGVASLTNKYVKTLNTPSIKILDTRKTTPGLRLFEKYAVTVGGGYNHRMDLYDGVMFKDNHLTVLDNLKKTLIKLKEKHPNKKIQLEVDTFNQLESLLHEVDFQNQVDAILLDNMSSKETAQCVELISSKELNCFIEISGGITLDNIKKYKQLKIDGISIGAITHQAVSKNIKLEFYKE